ncbi:MAG: hypothetical protein IKZ95_06975 [Lachnospiraceae bacterium]|nr:hypothetical protein [Lachnospiraceae bacterium]
MKKKGLYFILIPIAVLVFGLIGYCGFLGTSFYEGVLSSLKFLKVEFGGITNNVFVEIARCLGILFYFSLLYAIAYALFDVIRLFFTVRCKDSVAVHGDSSMAKYCARNIRGGKHCVLSDSKESFRAKKQILWFDDDTKAMSFYDTNRSALAKDEVYIAINTIPVEGMQEENVHLFNVNENIAITYWEKHIVTEPEKIVIIGSGPLAEQILEQALLMNVYAKEGGIQYHVIGDFELYQAMHPSLQEAVALTKDMMTFSRTAWYAQLDTILSADRIILAGADQENAEIAKQLINYGIRKDVHLHAESEETKALFRSEQVVVFGTLKELLGEDGENLFQDGVYQAGKLHDALYDVLSVTVIGEDEENAFKTLYSKTKKEWADDNQRWANLPGFLKRSNIAAAKHGAVKKIIMQKVLADFNAAITYEEYVKGGVRGARKFWNDPENKAIVDYLQEIEHLRWWRFYLLNHYTCGEGTTKEELMAQRKNPNMKDYSLLDEETKGYDGPHYWILAFEEEQ